MRHGLVWLLDTLTRHRTHGHVVHICTHTYVRNTVVHLHIQYSALSKACDMCRSHVVQSLKDGTEQNISLDVQHAISHAAGCFGRPNSYMCPDRSVRSRRLPPSPGGSPRAAAGLMRGVRYPHGYLNLTDAIPTLYVTFLFDPLDPLGTRQFRLARWGV